MKTPFLSSIIATGILATLLAGEAVATERSGTIYSFQVEANGSFSFVLTGIPDLCTNGTLNNNKRGAVVVGIRGVTADGLKMMYSAVMAAFMAGKHVTVRTDDTVTTTGWGCSVYFVDVSS
ncbi:hypothetical protein [Myxococcus eversor]|uniref:hypothetical protein n=1 Tax=Myxococcus eversor TaxID=2709661 RepID=UPI0013D69006|nr:hypothetical protein [Myxococcus eversor]